MLQGTAALALLQTYHDERQPLGKTITEQSLANAVSMGRLQMTRKTTSARPEYLNEQGMIFGASYSSGAVVPDGSPPPAIAKPVTDYAPSGRPGGRAPHVWLKNEDGARTSSIDLETYGIEESGAVLARPDGHVGWRSASLAGDPGRALIGAMNAIQEGRRPCA